ncbi:MAG: universal stress protein [Candidatus Promineifilaceae bacterium]|nr:universal stress protein [Candidatus Promineifilaceae bacterium]
MFENILVPLDGSSLAERALPPAATIATATQGSLTLLRVVPQFALLAADPTLYEEMNRMGEDESLSYLRSVIEEMDLTVPIRFIGETGNPADVIIRVAEAENIDLILMSSHGRSGVNRWVYGSVAERVLRRSPCTTAILNARAGRHLPENPKILIPLDGSDLAEKALSPAKTLAKAINGELHLLQVTPSAHQMLETRTMKPVFDGIEEKEVENALEYLQEVAAASSEHKVHVTAQIEKANVAENIIEYAAQHDIDIIVMSSHGRTGLSRWVYGSVAEKVLRSACCTTMIIRHRQIQ